MNGDHDAQAAEKANFAGQSRGRLSRHAQVEAAPGTAGLLVCHLPSYEEVANIAVFAASDWTRTMTASEINFTGGAVVD